MQGDGDAVGAVGCRCIEPQEEERRQGERRAASGHHVDRAGEDPYAEENQKRCEFRHGGRMLTSLGRSIIESSIISRPVLCILYFVLRLQRMSTTNKEPKTKNKEPINP